MSAVNTQKWLRRLHAWLGAALIGLLLFFAITGFALNHRAILKIPFFDKHEVTIMLPLAEPPADPQQLAARLAGQFGFPPGQMQIKREAAREIEWAGRPLTQPEQWIISANQPAKSLRADYWAGNAQAEVRLSQPNLWLHLARLHMAIGTGPVWVVLADLVVAGLLFLAISGLWLWSRLHGSRRRLIGLSGGGLALALMIGWAVS
jgi:hypothetical protein